MSDVFELKPVQPAHQGQIIDLLTTRLKEAAEGKLSSLMIAYMVPGDQRLFVNFAGISSPFEMVGLLEAAKISLLPANKV